MTKNKTNKALSEALNVEPIIYKDNDNILNPIEENSFNISETEDFELTRKTMKKMLDKGVAAVDELFELAKQNKHPRSFEVLLNLIKTTSDVSKDLYNLQKMKKELKQINDKPTQPDGTINVEKAVFVGTTAELLKRVKAEQK